MTSFDSFKRMMIPFLKRAENGFWLFLLAPFILAAVVIQLVFRKAKWL